MCRDATATRCASQVMGSRWNLPNGERPAAPNYSSGMTTNAIVVGTGSMGPEIAATFATAGIDVAIVGRDPGRTADAAARALTLGGYAVRADSITERAFATADIVVETIAEDINAKQDLYATIEPWLQPQALLLTNTSSLQIGPLGAALAAPERFAGFHFLKPAHLTGVVEVIPGPQTGPATTDTLVALAVTIGKTPLVVQRDVPGFIWNRIQFAVLRECLHMLETGVASADDIDAAVADGLAPRWMAAGPLATADLGGLATFARICAQLFPHLATNQRAPAAITDSAERGTPLQPWTTQDGVAIGSLREDALEAGRAMTAARRTLMYGSIPGARPAGP